MRPSKYNSSAAGSNFSKPLSRLTAASRLEIAGIVLLGTSARYTRRSDSAYTHRARNVPQRHTKAQQINEFDSMTKIRSIIKVYRTAKRIQRLTACMNRSGFDEASQDLSPNFVAEFGFWPVLRSM